MLGFGDAMEDYLPLEAISHGIVYLQPIKDQKFFENLSQNRPNLIKFTSQNPYLQDKIGEPYVYNLDFQDSFKFKKILDQIIQHPVNEPFIPDDFSTVGYLHRLDQIISTRNFCNSEVIVNDKNIELEMHISFLGNPGKMKLNKNLPDHSRSCSETCKFHKLTCDTDFFDKIHEDLLVGGNLLCKKTLEGNESYHPSINLTSNICYMQKDKYLLNCRAKPEPEMARFCPCVRYLA